MYRKSMISMTWWAINRLSPKVFNWWSIPEDRMNRTCWSNIWITIHIYAFKITFHESLIITTNLAHKPTLGSKWYKFDLGQQWKVRIKPLLQRDDSCRPAILHLLQIIFLKLILLRKNLLKIVRLPCNNASLLRKPGALLLIRRCLIVVNATGALRNSHSFSHRSDISLTIIDCNAC